MHQTNKFVTRKKKEALLTNNAVFFGVKLNNQVLHQINKGYLLGASFDVIMTLICKPQKERY